MPSACRVPLACVFVCACVKARGPIPQSQHIGRRRNCATGPALSTAEEAKERCSGRTDNVQPVLLLVGSENPQASNKAEKHFAAAPRLRPTLTGYCPPERLDARESLGVNMMADGDGARTTCLLMSSLD